MNAIELSLFVSRMEAVCFEMGVVLRRTAFSPNIKDRLDYSCALFDASGNLCAQAAHIPVHLGSMAFAMASVVSRFDWQAGDVVILNDPFLGGTHLPDVTFINPVFAQGSLVAFVVNRAHHANIGASAPGSMPVSSTLEEEGLLISPRYLYRAGKLQADICAELQAALGRSSVVASTRAPGYALTGDLAAQYSANQVGVERLLLLVARMRPAAFSAGLLALNTYGESVARAALQNLPAGTYRFADVMDDDGQSGQDIAIKLSITVTPEGLSVDFSGTHAQVRGNINCPLAVTAAAVYYAFRCLLPDQAPACAGLFRLVTLVAAPGTLVNALSPAAVAAGNVETSSRIVDAMFGALQQALPALIPAASQGTMNNVAMGAHNGDSHWDYYETLAGGMGAGPQGAGSSAVHTHMTNTLNTPVESLELHYPLQVLRYQIRKGSGGAGKYPGGDGLVREYRFLAPATVSLLTERRRHQPWGLAGGQAGQTGSNSCNGAALPGKTTLQVVAGDSLCIATPGGGGWGLAAAAPD